jgi:hypothetical protein
MLVGSRAARGHIGGIVRARCLATVAAKTTATESLPPLRFLIIDGYIRHGREVLEAGGATTAGQLYADMLVRAAARVTDVPAVYDLVYPADPGFEAPDLTQVRLDAAGCYCRPPPPCGRWW